MQLSILHCSAKEELYKLSQETTVSCKIQTQISNNLKENFKIPLSSKVIK